MQSICILLIRIEILKSLQPFPKSVMWDIASRVLRGLIFAVAHPGKIQSPRPLCPLCSCSQSSQCFTNEWRFPAHADGVSLYGMVCLLHR